MSTLPQRARNRAGRLTFLTLSTSSVIALAALGCGNGSSDSASGGSSANTGGSTSATGGAVTTGGIASSGGASNTGGTNSTGGSNSNGGSTTNGGTTSGGTVASTGGTNAGGASGNAGASAKGGAAATGGAGGGKASTGGSANTGGATTGGTATAGTSTGGTGGASTDGLYISPTGVDTNPGTQAQPLLTLGKANQVAKAGTTIWVMAGTFKYGSTQLVDKKATMAAPLRVWAVAGSRPIFDFSTQTRSSSSRGIELKGDYVHIRGIEVMKAGDNGIAISGSNNTVEDVILHGNEDTGLQITVPSATTVDQTRGANNLILNCDSYENLDTASGGENADGFAAKLRIGAGNVFRGCRAWNNADDGWDLFASNDIVQIDNCWAFLNGKPSAGGNPAGDGNGFKLGGAPDASDPDQGGAVHVVTNSTSFDNLTCGFVRNNNPELPKLTSCGVHGNNQDYCNLTCTPSKTITTTGAQAKTIARAADGSLPAIQ